jgi:hypothetical protein
VCRAVGWATADLLTSRYICFLGRYLCDNVEPSRIIVGLVVATIAVFIALFDWNWFKTPLATYLSAKLGRKISIVGELHGQFSFSAVYRGLGGHRKRRDQ